MVFKFVTSSVHFVNFLFFYFFYKLYNQMFMVSMLIYVYLVSYICDM